MTEEESMIHAGFEAALDRAGRGSARPAPSGRYYRWFLPPEGGGELQVLHVPTGWLPEYRIPDMDRQHVAQVLEPT